MKLIGPAGTELRHILAIYIMCCCDLDLWLTFPKIGSRDPEFVLNVHGYLKIYRRFSFWYIRSLTADLVAPLLGNTRCYGNHFVLYSLGVILMLASKYEVHVTTRNGVMAYFTLIHYMPVWPRSLTYFHRNRVMSPGPHLQDMCLFWSL